MVNAHLRRVTGWLLAAGVAALVTFLGFQFAQGDEPGPLPPEPTPPPGMQTPPPDFPTPPPLAYRLFPAPPEPTPTLPPTSVTINGIAIPLALGMSYEAAQFLPHLRVRPPPEITSDQPDFNLSYLIEYDEYPNRVGASWVYYDDGATVGSHILLGSHVLPDDQLIFDAILSAFE